MRKLLSSEVALATLDGVYVHVKAPDIPSHDGDIEGKVQVLEAINRGFFGRLGEMLDLDSLLVCVTADHATPVELRAHSRDPVPVLVYGGLDPDGAGPFGEGNASRGSYGYLVGPELMPRLAHPARA